MNVSNIIFQKLVEKGIDTCFMVTGGGAMFLNDALYQNKKIKKIFCHHEQACAMAADAYYRLSGKPAIVQVTTGPGSINALNGIFGAHVDSVAMIIIAGQVKSSDMTSLNKNLKNLRQFGDQETNIRSISRTITKKNFTISKVQNTVSIIEEAIDISTSGRPGPVLVEVPLDIQNTFLKNFKKSKKKNEKKNSQYQKKKLKFLLKKIKYSKRPIMIVGNGIRFSNSFNLFKKLIKKLKIPILTVWNSHDLIENDNPYYAGRPGLDGERAGNFNIQNSDLLIIMGARMHVRQIGYNFKSFAREAYKVMIDIDQAEINKKNLNINLKIVTEINGFIKKLLNSKNKDFYNPWHQKYLKWCKNNVKRFNILQKKHLKFNQNHINPYAFICNLFDEIKPNSNIITGDGTAAVITFKAARLKKNQRMFTNKGCASMGYDLPAIVGAYFSNKKKDLICITGDGSIMMNLQELQTISGNKIPAKIFILNNEGYHSIRQTQHNYFNGREIGCGKSSGLTFPSFKKIANAFNFKYFRIKNIKDCKQKMKSILNYKKALICEVNIDKNQLFEPRIVSYKDSKGKLKTPPLEEMTPLLSNKTFNEIMIIKKWQD